MIAQVKTEIQEEKEMVQPRPSKPVQWGVTLKRIIVGILIVSGIACFCGGFAYMGYSESQIRATQSQWPTVLGTIQISRLEERCGEQEADVYIVVTFEYQVENVRYLGKQDWYVGGSTYGQLVDKEMSEYTIGRIMPIYYNPKNPEEAVINPNLVHIPIIHWIIYVLLLIGGPILIGLGIALSEKARRPKTSTH